MTSLIWLGRQEGRKRGRTVFVFSKGTLSAEAPCVHQGLEKWWLGVGLGHPPYQLHSLLSPFLSFQKSPFLVYSTDIKISDNISESPWDPPHGTPLNWPLSVHRTGQVLHLNFLQNPEISWRVLFTSRKANLKMHQCCLLLRKI